MKKKFLILTASFLMTLGLCAQNIQDTTVNIGAQTVPGFFATVSQDTKTVQDVLKQKFKAAKLKSSNSEGYTAVLGQTIPEIATVPVNLYVKIGDMGRRSDKVTTITICAMPMNIADKVPDIKNYVRRYLEDIIKQATRQEAAVALATAESTLKKAQKNHDSAVSDLTKLNKSLQKDQDKIAANQKEIDKLQSKVNNLEENNASLKKSIEKNNEQKAKLEKDIEQTNQTLQNAQSEVEKYRSLAQ